MNGFLRGFLDGLGFGELWRWLARRRMMRGKLKPLGFTHDGKPIFSPEQINRLTPEELDVWRCAQKVGK